MGSRAQAQRLWCMGLVALWQVGSSGPGLEPVSPALAGGFLTTVPPGKSYALHLKLEVDQHSLGILHLFMIPKALSSIL